MRRREFLAAAAAATVVPIRGLTAMAERDLIYVAEPGIRNYLDYGGIGVLVFDASDGYRLLRRIPTWPEPKPGEEAENVKGVAASAKTGRLYVTTIKRIGCIDLRTDKMLWDKTIDGGCDRLAISPDGRILYVPSFEGPHWTVVDAISGAVITTLVLNTGAHNTIFSPTGRRVYLAGLHSPILSIADAHTHKVVNAVGPFGNAIRPFTINGAETYVYVNVNDLLGFEVGDLRTGKMIHRVVVEGFSTGPVERHGCPSHGIALTPDERELWVSDGHNRKIHIFDNTVMPPKQIASLTVRDLPGWITMSLDGRFAYPSTGEVFDVRTRQRVKALSDEVGRDVGSEKLVEIVTDGTRPIRAGDQFAIGLKR
jgi:DNA-binding beta-propeller fold protein YncE